MSTPSRKPSRRSEPAAPGGLPSATGSPWESRAYVVYGVLWILGAGVFLSGMSVVSRETTYQDQAPGINLAVAGVVLSSAAGVFLLLIGRRAVTARRVALLGVVPEEREHIVRPTSVTARSVQLVGRDGLTHFHRADCVMAAGRDWPALDRVIHESAGRTACGVCNP